MESADTAVTASSGPKACDLLTAEEIESIIAIDVDAGETISNYGGVSQCQFNRAGGSEGAVMVSLHEQGEILNYQKVPGSARVAGLGDVAVWNPQTNQFAVKKGAAVVSISFLFSPARQEWATRLAGSALPKL